MAALRCLFWCVYAVAAMMDYRTRKVYRFLWWIQRGLMLACIFLDGNCTKTLLAELSLFAVVQWGLFRRFYGKADVQAFLCSAYYWTSLGYGFEMDIFHMSLTFTFLALTQLLRGNVNSGGNLKKPVAFVPFILIGQLVLRFSLCLFY